MIFFAFFLLQYSASSSFFTNNPLKTSNDRFNGHKIFFYVFLGAESKNFSFSLVKIELSQYETYFKVFVT